MEKETTNTSYMLGLLDISGKGYNINNIYIEGFGYMWKKLLQKLHIC